MAVARFFTSIAQPTTLAGGIANTSTSIQVAATIGFPTSYPYTLALDYGASAEELVDVTNAAGTTLTVTRGVDGTSAQSHSIGAVVRHTSSGRDFADFQTHAAATAGVHGVAGTLVGTSDAQTLANKTLTTPSISGATLSGTLSGNPTFSGSPVLSGAPSFTGGPSFSGVRPVFTRSAATNAALGTRITTDTVDRLEVDADGTHKWGSGTATADTNLYRNAVGELKTDTALTVVGNLTAGNMQLGAWTTWTPAWTTSTGLHSPSYGDAAVVAQYAKFGRTLIFSVYITFGAGTNFGAGAVSTDNWQFGLPAGLTASNGFASVQAPCGFGRASASSTATAPILARVNAAGTSFTLDTAGGQQGGGALASPGLLDSVSPWTWATGNAVAFTGALETTT